MKRILVSFLVALLPIWVASKGQAADKFELKDGDRVVLVGNTLIEREQRYGYWETALTSRYPDRHITFRNLGWSGDTVFGDARASFDTPVEGFQRLKDHVLAVKPTVILIAYGTNESFEGKKGLPGFEEGFNKLLDALAPAKARIVLLSPLQHEDLGRPLPDPKEQNKNIKLYTEAIEKIAAKRKCHFVNLNELLGSTKDKSAAPLTENGMHLTGFGYWRTASALERGLGIEASRWLLDVGKEEQLKTSGVKAVRDRESPLRFEITDTLLPAPPLESTSLTGVSTGPSDRLVRIHGLEAGQYALKIDGKEVVQATAQEWKEGMRLKRGPEFDQAEKLRRLIIPKNRLYFYRWRPQNETYIFGFRKAEQGKNAIEIPKFDPLIEEKEKEIAKLRIPVVHTYEWTPVKKDEK